MEEGQLESPRHVDTWPEEGNRLRTSLVLGTYCLLLFVRHLSRSFWLCLSGSKGHGMAEYQSRSSDRDCIVIGMTLSGVRPLRMNDDVGLRRHESLNLSVNKRTCHPLQHN